MPDPLFSVSPLDGRYERYTSALTDYASEAALMRARVRVEIEYLYALSNLSELPISISSDDLQACRSLYETFDGDSARLIKQIETEGYGNYPATNHDVKAIEYFIRDQLPERLSDLHPWIHFGLTSEDVTNLAYRLLIKEATTTVLLPELTEIIDQLTADANEHKSTVMLAHTHGQPATPTTYGKELAVYVDRLDREQTKLINETDELTGKLAGASGTFAAHHAAYPFVDWPAFARSFITDLGLKYRGLVTQINPGDDLAALFHALTRINQILIDLNEDMWFYISKQYLGQQTTTTETGSSTMPHKVNPIDFENSEGNLEKANSDLSFLADAITTSRLQRDLSDSTIKRNIGSALAHCLIGYTKTLTGLRKTEPNTTQMNQELTENPAVITEAIQTILRREGLPDAYEQVKAISRGKELTLDDIHAAIDDFDIDQPTKDELKSLTPKNYVGIAEALVTETTPPET